jgi:hypothetical protein
MQRCSTISSVCNRQEYIQYIQYSDDNKPNSGQGKPVKLPARLGYATNLICTWSIVVVAVLVVPGY